MIIFTPTEFVPLVLLFIGVLTCIHFLHMIHKDPYPPPRRLPALLISYIAIAITTFIIFTIRFQTPIDRSNGIYVVYVLTRICVYMFFFYRLTLTFENTMFSCSDSITKFFIFVNILIFLIGLAITIYILVQGKVTSVLTYLIFFVIVWDIPTQLSLGYSFVWRLGRVGLRHHVPSNSLNNDVLKEEDTKVDWENEFLATATKTFVLGVIAAVSSFGNIILFVAFGVASYLKSGVIVDVIALCVDLWVMCDALINFVCMLFVFKYYENAYGKCCKRFEPGCREIVRLWTVEGCCCCCWSCEDDDEDTLGNMEVEVTVAARS